MQSDGLGRYTSRELSYLHSTHSVCMGRYGGEPVQCSTEQLGHGTFAQAREPGGRRWAHLSKAGVRRYSLVTDKMALIRLSVDRGGRLPSAGHLNSQKIPASNLPGRPRTRVGRGSCRNKAGPDHTTALTFPLMEMEVGKKANLALLVVRLSPQLVPSSHDPSPSSETHLFSP